MATVDITIAGHNNSEQAIRSVSAGIESVHTSVNKLNQGLNTLAMGFSAWYVGSKIWEGFKYGIGIVDEFQQRVITMSAMITSLQSGADVAGNYQKAKEYAAGLNEVLMQIDARTTLNLQNLQVITEEMIKQGIVLDYNSTAQVEGFTRLANAAAVYSRNGADERQLRQEVSALLRGQVDQSSQLASIVQKTVQGPLSQQVEQWKQSGTLVENLGKQLKGFGPASDDLNKTWSAVKTSMETSLNLIARAGFTSIVKEIVDYLDTINTYLKSHREEVGDKIKSAWETTKTVMSTVADVASAIYNNFEPFAALVIGGAIISGVTRIISLFTALRDVVLTTRAAMITVGALSAMAPAAGAATVAGGAAVAGSGAGLLATIGGGLAGAGLAIGGGIGLGYMLQPAVRWADKKLYQNLGWNLTGEAFYNEQHQKELDADARYKWFTSENANYKGPGSTNAPVPVIQLEDTPEQVKHKTEQYNKELATFKELQDRKAAMAKAAADVEMATLKGRFDQGLASTRTYYDEEKRIAVEAAEKELEAAEGYLDKIDQRRENLKGKSILEYLAKNKGTDSPEYQSELKKREEAITAVEKAELHLQKTTIDTDNKSIEAIHRRNEEYAKLQAITLESANKYEEAESVRQDSDRKSYEYLKLKREAEEGASGATSALAAKELEFENRKLEAKQKVIAAERAIKDAQFQEQQQIAQLNGADQQLLDAERNLYDGKKKALDLQLQLTKAVLNGASLEIQALQTKLNMQDRENTLLERKTSLLEQVGVLSGQIVGFSNGQAIYANSGGSFNNGIAVPGYQSPTDYLSAQLQSGQSGRSSADSYSGFVNPNIFPSNLSAPFLGSFAVGTNYVPADGYAFVHKGEAIQPTKYNPAAGGVGLNSGSPVTIQGGITIQLPNVTRVTEAEADQIARMVFTKTQQFAKRYV